MQNAVNVAVRSSDPQLRRQLARHFDDCRVAFLESAEEVKSRFSDGHAPQVLIWDLRSEGKSHGEALKIIQKVSPRVPVIALAWGVASARGPRFYRTGNVCVVQRPMSPAVLRSLVDYAQDGIVLN